jgi:hypothetical protein
VDARLSFRPRGREGRWLIYVEVINVLDRDNAATVEYDIRFDEAGDPFLADTRREGGVPLLPTFGVRFRF